MTEQKSELIELGGLWKHESQAGKTYLSGSLGGARILVFQNVSKKQDNHPDYRMFVAPRKKDKNRGSGDSDEFLDTASEKSSASGFETGKGEGGNDFGI